MEPAWNYLDAGIDGEGQAMSDQYRPLWWRPWLDDTLLRLSDLHPDDRAAPEPSEGAPGPAGDVQGYMLDAADPEKMPPPKSPRMSRRQHR